MLAINPCVHENTLDNLIGSHMTLKDVNDLVNSDKNIEEI